jgi:hypothetical protein
MHTHQTRISFLDTAFPELDGYLGQHDPALAPLPPYYPDAPEVRQTVARYYDAITAMDANVGRLLAELEQDGVADNTIVFFYGDHGMGLPRGKRTLYDSGLKVPLIAYFPPKWEHLAPAPRGATDDRVVSFIDFAPTVLNLAGHERPDYMQGRAFLGEDVGTPRIDVVGARDRVDEAYDLARAVRDDRYLYIRHYHPHRSWNQPEYFSDQAAIRRAITQRAEAGALNEAQLTYAGPTRPVEALFDTASDPHQVENLADSASHDVVLQRMRRRLREWQVETRDAGFLPESMALRLSQDGRTPMDLARDPAVYPLERILETASLVGHRDAVPDQVTQLRDENAVVRYWAAVGLVAAGRAAAPAASALGGALDDATPEVRIASAEALVKLNGSPAALRTLQNALQSDESQVVLLTARTLQLLGPAAAPARSAMERVLARAQDESTYGIDALFIRFALEPALSKPKGPAQVIEGPGRDLAPGSSPGR